MIDEHLHDDEARVRADELGLRLDQPPATDYRMAAAISADGGSILLSFTSGEARLKDDPTPDDLVNVVLPIGMALHLGADLVNSGISAIEQAPHLVERAREAKRAEAKAAAAQRIADREAARGAAS